MAEAAQRQVEAKVQAKGKCQSKVKAQVKRKGPAKAKTRAEHKPTRRQKAEGKACLNTKKKGSNDNHIESKHETKAKGKA